MGNGESKNVVQKNRNVFSVNCPRPFMTEEEFFKGWPTWKTNFFVFQKESLIKTSNKQQWGNMLLNLMGPIGLNIYSTFTFTSIDDKENGDILLQMFDEFFIFATRKKLSQENIYEYIKSLQQTVREKNIQNGEEVIRKRILKEIDQVQFTNAAKELFPTFIFSYNYNKLTLKEIAFIWDYYGNSDAKKRCPQCAGSHTPDNCPALGKQCIKCKNPNHFARRCPLAFIHNCNYCGGSHAHRNCPSYNETCTKCKKQHHFSWKCQQVYILKCHSCKLSHPASRALCPAKNSVCTICHNVGHFASTCRRRM